MKEDLKPLEARLLEEEKKRFYKRLSAIGKDFRDLIEEYTKVGGHIVTGDGHAYPVARGKYAGELNSWLTTNLGFHELYFGGEYTVVHAKDSLYMPEVLEGLLLAKAAEDLLKRLNMHESED